MTNYFLVDFFFGPCLDISAVDPRQGQEAPHHQRRHRSHNPNNHQERNLQSQSSSSTTTKPRNRNSERRLHDNGSTKTNKRNNKSSAALSLDLFRLHTPTRNSPRGKSETTTRGGGGILTKYNNGGAASKYNHLSSRSDDASVMTASLAETYRAYSTKITENEKSTTSEEYLEEQSVIRRSLKDRASASENPYTVLGVSQLLSSRVIDLSYRAKIKDAKVQQQQRGCHYKGGEVEINYCISEEAIADVMNAYRQIKADIQRQEEEEILQQQQQRRQQQQQQQQQNRRSSQQKNTNNNDSSRQQQRSTTFTDSNQRRVKSNNSSSSQKNTHHIKCNNSHTGDIDDEEEEEDDNSSFSAKTRISKRLKDHRELVHDLFAKHNKPTRTNSSTTGVNDGGGRGSPVTTTNATTITTLQQSITNQNKAIAEMKLVPIEAGANNINEQKQLIKNNCFYLSLAASYLCGVGAFDNVNESSVTTATTTTSVRDNANNNITTDNGVDHGSSSDSTIAVLEKRQKVITMNLALQLKRAIESAVLLVHPEWAKSGMVGEEVQAFSDFLVYALDSNSVLGHWAIAVFDEASGFVDVYRGRHYGKIYPPTKKRILSSSNSSSAARVRWSYKDCNETIKRGNTLTLRYIPGHYQPLIPEMVTNKIMYDKQSSSSSLIEMNTTSRVGNQIRSNRPALEEILSTLDKWNVLHVVTDGRA